MSGIGVISFDALFEPVKTDPVDGDRLFGFDSEGNVNAAFTILGLRQKFGGGDWNSMANKPTSFTPSAHTLGSHSNVAALVDSAPDGTIIKKVAGQWTAVVPDYAEAGDIPNVPSWVLEIAESDKTNWNAAFGWGDHAEQGYLKSFSETDPVFLASAAASITETLKSNWSAAFGWGDHAEEGYLKSFTETDPTVPQWIKELDQVKFSMYDAKLEEYAGFADGEVPMVTNGAARPSGLIAQLSENPFDPDTEPEEFEAWEAEVLSFAFPVPVSGLPAEEDDQFVTKGQMESRVGNAVSYDAQPGKTEPEKAQARDNIDVYSRQEIDSITGDLNDLNTADKTNLVRAINQKGQYRSVGW